MTTELTTIPSKQDDMMMPATTFLLHPEIEKRSAMLAKSTIIPDMFKNNPANCMIALDMALRMKMNPLMVMQNLYVIHGKPSLSGQFVIACINNSGQFKTPLRFKFSGKEGTDDYGCVAYVVDNHDHTLESTKITIAMAKAEKWWSKKDKNGNETSKWQTMPQQMMMYRAAAFFARTYCPEVMMGMLSQDEAIDIQPVPITYASPSQTLDIQSTTKIAVAEAVCKETELIDDEPPNVNVYDLDEPEVQPNNPMWDGNAEFPPPEYDRQAEIETVKRLIDEGYFMKDDYKIAMELYNVRKISDLSEAGFESFALKHIPLVKLAVDESRIRNIPLGKLNEFARDNNEHSFLVSSIETKKKFLDLIAETTIV